MKKEFLGYVDVRNNALKLAHHIHEEGFDPDVIYVSLRGGAYLGNVISEYFKCVRRDRHPVFYAAVVAWSYTDVHKSEQVRVDGWTYDPEHLRHGDRVILVDDIFDTGRTINHLAEIIMRRGIPREDIKVVVHDYKIRTYAGKEMPIRPDYYCRRHVVERPEDDTWIHYLSHELVGLTEEERQKQYYDLDPELRGPLESAL
jgi:hypoxanthine phosphoribosyltransferase